VNVPFRANSTQGLSNENLPTAATYVLVDNTTNQWLYQPDAQRFIAPYAMNVSMPLAGVGGANMQVAAPPGVTQPAPIAGQQYLATFSDTAPGGYPYTSQMNVDITNGQVDATITGGTVDATITGTANVNITNATLDATITNATLDVNSTLVHKIINGIVLGDTVFPNSAWTELGWGGAPLAAFYLQQVNISTPISIGFAMGPGGGPYTPFFFTGKLQQYIPFVFAMPAGLAIPGNTVIGVFNYGTAPVEIMYAFYPAL